MNEDTITWSKVLISAIGAAPAIIAGLAILVPTLRKIHTAVNSNWTAVQVELKALRSEIASDKLVIASLEKVVSGIVNTGGAQILIQKQLVPVHMPMPEPTYLPVPAPVAAPIQAPTPAPTPIPAPVPVTDPVTGSASIKVPGLVEVVVPSATKSPV